jgi:tRNA A-37 threonylcarbamoyl transferase component Bud32
MKTNGEIIEILGKPLTIIKHIGRGKSGDSYHAKFNKRDVVYKEMYYGPCDTYTFEENKLQAELHAYQELKKIGIPMPELIYYDTKKQFLIKAYVDGPTIADVVGAGELKDSYVKQMFDVCKLLYAKGTNIDYFPTNFVVEGGKLFYIDYECSNYTKEWDFENWGIYFWANTQGMAKFLQTGDHAHLSKDNIPHKEGLEDTVRRLMELKG